MKKIIVAALAVFCCCNAASARGFLIKGGVEFPHYNVSNLGDLNFKEMTGWHAGIGYQTGSLLGFSLQPELLFQHSEMDGNLGIQSFLPMDDTERVRINNLQLVANVQWGIDLLIFRPYIFAAPFVSYDLTDIKQFLNRKKWDYGIGAGVGLDIWKLQLSAKYNWAFGGIIDWNSYVDGVKNISANTGAVIISLAFTF